MTLGCLEHVRFRIVRNGRVVYETDDVNCTWNRVVDDISVAQFSIAASNQCCLATIHARSDLVEFVRNGVVEWAGYVQRPVEENGVLSLECVDLLDGYNRRIVRDAINVTNTDLSIVAKSVLDSADWLDPIPVVHVITNAGISIDKTVFTNEYRIAWDVLKNDLLGIGLDMTMAGTLLYVGPLEAHGLRPLRLRDPMIIGKPTIGEDGSSFANRVIARGANDLVSVYPIVMPTSFYPYPLVEAVVDASGIEDQTSLDKLAKEHYDLRSQTPRFVSMGNGVVLSDDSPYPLRAYIAGRLINIGVSNECTVIQQGMRLNEVRYALTGGVETVSISAVPIGTINENMVVA